jgi:hypothetical protein
METRSRRWWQRPWLYVLAAVTLVVAIPVTAYLSRTTVREFVDSHRAELTRLDEALSQAKNMGQQSGCGTRLQEPIRANLLTDPNPNTEVATDIELGLRRVHRTDTLPLLEFKSPLAGVLQQFRSFRESPSAGDERLSTEETDAYTRALGKHYLVIVRLGNFTAPDFSGATILTQGSAEIQGQVVDLRTATLLCSITAKAVPPARSGLHEVGKPSFLERDLVNTSITELTKALNTLNLGDFALPCPPDPDNDSTCAPPAGYRPN